MANLVAIFASLEDAQLSAAWLRELGVEDDRLSIIAPGEEIPSVDGPKWKAEQSRVGKALGGVVGGAIGAAGGLQLGAAASSLLLPGVGPVMLIGLAGAALLGSGGIVAGSTAGAAIEQAIFGGLSATEIRSCEESLRAGRTLLVLYPRNDDEAADLRAALKRSGAEFPAT